MDSFIGVMAAILITLFLFLIGREIVCWYFKINQITSILEEIRDALKNKN